jgi:dolichol-phosphate mannosyltransferase
MASRLVILPTYNEAENLAVLIPRIFKFIPDVSVLVIDDGSPDGTAAIADDLKSKFPRLEVIKRGKKMGLGSAYRIGFAWALKNGFTEIIEMDADMSHRLRDLSKILDVKGAELVIGSRWMTGGGIENWSTGRQLLSKLANRYVEYALRLGVTDATSGFRVYKSSLIKKFPLHSMRSDGYAFQIEMTRAARKNGAKIVEVPITFRERVSGSSKMSKRIIVEAIFLVTIWGLKRLIRAK